MTIAEQFKAEGWQQGWQQGVEIGKLLIAKRLLEKKVALSFIEEITGLSLATIKAIQEAH